MRRRGRAARRARAGRPAAPAAGPAGRRDRRSSCPASRSSGAPAAAGGARGRRARPRRRTRRAGGRAPRAAHSSAAEHGDAQPDAGRPRRVGDGPVADQAERGRDLGGVLGRQAQQRAVEQRGLVEVVERLGQRDVVDVRDRSRPGPPPSVRAGSAAEVGEPAVARRPGAAEEHRGPVRGGDGGQVRLGRSAGAGEHRGEQRLARCAAAGRVVGLDAERRDGGAPARPAAAFSSTRACPAPTAAPAWCGAARCARSRAPRACASHSPPSSRRRRRAR